MLTDSWLPRVSPPPTWQEIAEAVEFVGYSNVAQKLRDKFCECHAYNSIQFNNIVDFHLMQIIRLVSLYFTGSQ